MPNVPQTVEAIRNLDLLVVTDILPTEITQWADIVLPEDVYLERYDDLFVGFGKSPFIGLRQPVVQSPYDTRPAWRIAILDLARMNYQPTMLGTASKAKSAAGPRKKISGGCGG